MSTVWEWKVREFDWTLGLNRRLHGSEGPFRVDGAVLAMDGAKDVDEPLGTL